MASIKIGPSFFVNEFKEYSNWHRSIIREFGQNSIDCGSLNIEFGLSLLPDGNTKLTCINDGEVMTSQILVDKLLALGESGKRFENGAVGGFGKAKIILYYAHTGYIIRTGDLQVIGSGGEYELTDGHKYLDGTTSVVTLKGDQVERLTKAVEWFANCAQWNGILTLNGVELKTNLRKGSPRRELEFGVVYTNRSASNKLIVRIHGIPMFSEYVDYDRCVIVELNGKSSEVLTANRDGLKYPYCSHLSSFITELAVDKKSALKTNKISKYQLCRGIKLRNQVEKARSTLSAILNVGHDSNVGWNVVSPNCGQVESSNVESSNEIGIGRSDFQPEPEISHNFEKSISCPSCSGSALQEEFIIKNDSNMIIPDCYIPTSCKFSSYSRKLVGFWAKLMLQLHRMFEHSAEFSIGFLFDDDTEDGDVEAQYERTNEFGIVYYLNPVKIRKQSCSNSRSMAKRFKLTEKDRLLSIAAHEFCHGLGFKHDEPGFNRLTDLFAVIMQRKKEFAWCFK